jgi:hypothetical protein
LGLSTVFAIAGLMLAFSGAAAAAVTTPLISTSTSESGGGSVGDGTVLNVTFNAAPVLAGSYSLTLTDGSKVATLSSTAGTLSAAVNGTSIAFTAHGATSLSLSRLEVLASTGVSDGSGNPWDLVASGQVDKSFIVSAGDQVVVNYNEPVTVGGSYSFTLSEGTGSAVIDDGNSNVASGNGTSTITYDVISNPSGTVAADAPTVSNASGVTAVPTLQVGDTLTAVASGGAGTIAASYSLTLSDGAGDSGTLTSGTNVTAGSPQAGDPRGRHHVYLHRDGCRTGDDGRDAAVDLRAHRNSRHGPWRGRRHALPHPHAERSASAVADGHERQRHPRPLDPLLQCRRHPGVRWFQLRHRVQERGSDRAGCL